MKTSRHFGVTGDESVLRLLVAMLAIGTGCALSHRAYGRDETGGASDQVSTDQVETDADDAFSVADGENIAEAGDVPGDSPMADAPTEIAADVPPDRPPPADIVDVPVDAGDVTPPTVGPVTPVTATVSLPLTFTASCVDNVGVIQCNLWIDGADQGVMVISGGMASRMHTFSTAGSHTAQVRCRDAALNNGFGPVATVTATLPPPVLIQFHHSADVMHFSDYWVRWEIPGTAISGWTSGHCVSGAPRVLSLPDNWTECELDVRLPLGTVLDFYPIYPGGGEVCGSGGPCPSNFLYRFAVVQGAVIQTGSSDLSFQNETVGPRVYRYLRVYLR